MTIQSQLDQVLALVDQFALTGRANWTHPKREVFANELRSRLSEIRAAVGGEAVAAAWMLRRKRDGFVRGCYATKPTDESLEFAELDGDYYTPLYASPTATVGVGALSERVSDLLHRIEGFGKAYPTDMFSEVTTEEREWLHATRPGLMDRIAANMGRHVSEKIADDLASIRNELAALIGEEA